MVTDNDVIVPELTFEVTNSNISFCACSFEIIRSSAFLVSSIDVQPMQRKALFYN